MKTIIGAIALVIAAPIAAQTAPANPQGGHSQQQRQQGQPQHQHGQPGQHQGQHGCCKQVNGRMECQMMMMGHGSQQGGQAQHQGHSGH